MGIKEETLRKSLSAVGLSSLPAQYNANSREFWLKAIVLVRKRNLEECYCLYDRKPNGLMVLSRDFGSASVVFSVKSIHPYLYFDERRFVPDDRSVEDKRMFLLHELDKDDANWYNVPRMDEVQLDRVIFERGISTQLESLDEDLMLNEMNESGDTERSPVTEDDEKRYRSDLFAMIREGRSQAEITAFREAFERRKEAQASREKRIKAGFVISVSDEAVSEADMLRQRMELEDEERIMLSHPVRSVAGEFDAPKIDYKKLKSETDEYRHEQIKACKRRWKREYDSMLRGEPVSDECVFENESGETEEVETLQLPEGQQSKVVAGMNAVTVTESGESLPSDVVVSTVKKRGRPRKAESGSTSSKRKTSTRKKRVTKAERS